MGESHIYKAGIQKLALIAKKLFATLECPPNRSPGTNKLTIGLEAMTVLLPDEEERAPGPVLPPDEENGRGKNAQSQSFASAACASLRDRTPVVSIRMPKWSAAASRFRERMTSLRSFLTEIIDYAGLFPPASLPMAAAVASYAEYVSGPDRDLLGRFVVPASRLTEFSDAARDLLPRHGDSEPWRLSVLAGDDTAADAKSILEFNAAHAERSEVGRAICDSVELHARQVGDVAQAVRHFPRSFRLFFEIATGAFPAPLIGEVAAHNAAAKIRTGGVTEASFPSSARVIHFIAACNSAGVPFKATAGLHHLIRSDYPLTYESDSACATMYGYLNLFLAAAFIRKGMSEIQAREVLEEQSLDALDVAGDTIAWRGHTLTADDLTETRSRFALSFGSCSFREPVDEARALHLL